MCARCAKSKIDTRFVIHHIRVIKTKLRNVTVTLEEQVARWARVGRNIGGLHFLVRSGSLRFRVFVSYEVLG
jgi:hypothetical protein